MNQLRVSLIVIGLLLFTPLVNANQQTNNQAASTSNPQLKQVTPPAETFNSHRIASPYQYQPHNYQFNGYRPSQYFPQAFDYEIAPTQVIKDTLQTITTFTSHTDNVNPVELRRFIEEQIIPHFDFDNMSHWITGPYARYMSTEEKSNFQKQLRETFLSSLAKHLGSFDADNTRIRFTPAHYRGENEAFVRTFIYRGQRPPMRLNFRMRRSGNTWKIIDVRANGASAVLYYRQHFMAQLRQYRNNSQYPY